MLIKRHHEERESHETSERKNCDTFMQGRTYIWKNIPIYPTVNKKAANNVVEYLDRLDRYFTEEGIQIFNKHMKLCSTALVIRKCK